MPCVSFGGLSKVHRACGYRVGWLSLSGDPMRTQISRCAATARRLAPVRERHGAMGSDSRAARHADDRHSPRPAAVCTGAQAVLEGVAASPYLDVVTPGGALYAFPRSAAIASPTSTTTPSRLRLLEEESVLVVPGSSFNVPTSRHLRLTLLPQPAQLSEVFVRMERVLERMAAEATPAPRARLICRSDYLALGDSYTIGEDVPRKDAGRCNWSRACASGVAWSTIRASSP
jgi:alanine-synthesizing transaminase